MSANPTVLDMVYDSLKERGFDGLVSDDFECSCELEDLAPCCEMSDQCTAGYKVTTCPDDCEPGCDFYITTTKPEPVCTSCGEPGYCSCCAADDERKRRKEEPET